MNSLMGGTISLAIDQSDVVLLSSRQPVSNNSILPGVEVGLKNSAWVDDRKKRDGMGVVSSLDATPTHERLSSNMHCTLTESPEA